MVILLGLSTELKAQVGEYRHVWTVGVVGGYAIDKIGFVPEVRQKNMSGYTFGAVARYTPEKLFSMICSIQSEITLTQGGWKEEILTASDQPVINPETGEAETYERKMTYIQIPVLAHLAWGKERNGFNAFINLGPQMGFLVGETINKNYTTPFTKKNFPNAESSNARSSSIVAQETLDVKNKFDYGIVLGAGAEVHINKVGRFQLEGRYYYGLGNIFGATKRDEFSKSNHGIISVRLAYLRDL